MPIRLENGEIQSVTLDDVIPDNAQVIGNYPQEIVIDELGKGTLLFPRTALLKDTHSLQCKVLKTATIYCLSVDILESRCKRFDYFEQTVTKVRMDLKEKYEYLDYYVIDETISDIIKRTFKGVILRYILTKREERKSGSSQIAQMVPKLKAVLSCEQAMNFELAERVMRGEIPPQYILDDGTLDPAAVNSEENSSLPKNHPIMVAFRGIFESITSPKGQIMKEYGVLEDIIDQQSDQMMSLYNEVCQLKQSVVQKLQAKGIRLESLGVLPPIERQIRYDAIPDIVITQEEDFKRSPSPKHRTSNMNLLSFIKKSNQL